MSGLSEQYHSLADFWKFFTKKLRLSNPWNFKAPFLIAVPYLVFLISAQKGPQPFIAILASLLIIIGVAGVGYLSNDLGDREKDSKVNKHNVTGSLSLATILLLFVIFAGLAILPWFFLAFNNLTILLLTFQFLLFFAYALPPFRLKEKGILGLITDTLYAHVLPALLAAYTFYLYTERSGIHFLLFVLLLCSWQFVLGLRNILFHQLKDLGDDLRSGTATFVSSYGENKTAGLLRKVLLPLELLAFVLFCAFLSCYFRYFLPLALCYWLITLIQNQGRSLGLGYRNFAYRYLDDLYVKWLPLFVLAALIIRSPEFIYLGVLHCLVFRNGLKDLIVWLRQKFL